jgi:hypothetical protein
VFRRDAPSKPQALVRCAISTDLLAKDRILDRSRIDPAGIIAEPVLRNRDLIERVGVNWHLAFFRRYLEVETKYSRPMDKQKIRVKNSDKFIEWFRRFQNIRNKWDIIDPDIYNMDESGILIGVK